MGDHCSNFKHRVQNSAHIIFQDMLTLPWMKSVDEKTRSEFTTWFGREYDRKKVEGLRDLLGENRTGVGKFYCPAPPPPPYPLSLRSPGRQKLPLFKPGVD